MKAFNETIEVYEVMAKDLAVAAKVGENQISLFRHRKSRIRCDTVQALLNALPREAQIYFVFLLTKQASGE